MKTDAFRPECVLVTGGAGFIGANFVRHVLGACDDVRIVNVDCLTYAGNLENLADIAEDPRYQFVRSDICETGALVQVCREHGVDWVSIDHGHGVERIRSAIERFTDPEPCVSTDFDVRAARSGA